MKRRIIRGRAGLKRPTKAQRVAAAYRALRARDSAMHPFDRRRNGYGEVAAIFRVSRDFVRHAVAYTSP